MYIDRLYGVQMANQLSMFTWQIADEGDKTTDAGSAMLLRSCLWCLAAARIHSAVWKCKITAIRHSSRVRTETSKTPSWSKYWTEQSRTSTELAKRPAGPSTELKVLTQILRINMFLWLIPNFSFSSIAWLFQVFQTSGQHVFCWINIDYLIMCK